MLGRRGRAGSSGAYRCPEVAEPATFLTAAAGFDWGERLTHASDYFPQFHALAVELIKEGKAYVDESSVEELRRMRGSLTQPGENSPFRDRSVADRVTY